MLTAHQLNNNVLPFFFVTRATENMANIWPPLTTIKAYCEAHKILSLLIITFKVVEGNTLAAFLTYFGSLAV